MQETPKSFRKSIALAGRVNAGKSSMLNALCGQEIAIVSEIPGTTTDAVSKAYELLGFGPVTFYDTAGFDDPSPLGRQRQKAAEKIFKTADLVLLVTDQPELAELEKDFLKTLEKPYLLVHTKADIHQKGVSAKTGQGIENLRQQIIEKLNETPGDNKLLTGLVNRGDKILLVAPIDESAPAGRLILPQVQILRELLDLHAIPTVVQLEEVEGIFKSKTTNYSLVITDSRVVKEVAAVIPPTQPLTTFSILFGRQKGNFNLYLQGATAIDNLKDGDKVLIAEACSHTTAEDDIARTVLPKLLQKYTGKTLHFEVKSGRDFPDDLQKYALVLHCGSCMLTPSETKSRLEHCRQVGVSVTNYGLAISKCQGIINRVIEPLK